eukprot:2085657-Rhodomonas_salina.1
MGFGKPLLLANVENELDPVLDPILDKSFIRKGKTFIVALADKVGILEIGAAILSLDLVDLDVDCEDLLDLRVGSSLKLA